MLASVKASPGLAGYSQRFWLVSCFGLSPKPHQLAALPQPAAQEQSMTTVYPLGSSRTRATGKPAAKATPSLLFCRPVKGGFDIGPSTNNSYGSRQPNRSPYASTNRPGVARAPPPVYNVQYPAELRLRLSESALGRRSGLAFFFFSLSRVEASPPITPSPPWSSPRFGDAGIL